VACVNTSPAWMSAGYPWSYSVSDYRPAKVWENPAAPRAYREFARFCWQLAARYGRAKHPVQKLTVDEAPRWTNDWPVNRPKSGLDLLEYIEVWNEPDKWWVKNTAAYLEPEHYAALLSACYDGHEGALGPGVGIKNADPSMKVVMAGLTNFDLAYLQRMVAWFQVNRKDRRFPADVVNFHHYSNHTGGLYEGFTKGISPEADGLREKLEPLIAWSRANVPGAPFWLSEFGYDTWQSSPQRAVPFGPYDATQVQAMWLQRSYLACIAAGVDVCFAYNLSDNHHGNGLFESSGLVQSEQNGFARKDSWYKIKELADRLDGLQFEKDVSTDDSVRMYLFKKENGQAVLAAWVTDDEASGVTYRSAFGAMVLDGWPRFVPVTSE
jgi:hypothetical protein